MVKCLLIIAYKEKYRTGISKQKYVEKILFFVEKILNNYKYSNDLLHGDICLQMIQFKNKTVQ